jgi:CDP-paratose 2-epimerase
MGKVDQGFLVLWAARHLFGGPLGYVGFGGLGLQVRDVLHIDDLYDLIRLQIGGLERFAGAVFNVGGGRERSVSLLELTRLCRDRSGRDIVLTQSSDTTPADVPYYVTDNAQVTAASGWAPRRDVGALLDDIYSWLRGHRAMLEPILGGQTHGHPAQG